jgi:hypothetical protein
LDWGGLIHSVDLPSFTASTLAMNGLRISNADDKVSGGRFSDLFNTQNYVNRKFTLHMGAVGVAVGDHAQIAEGIITDQMTQDFDSLTLALIEDLSNVAIEVPTNRVDSATYTNAPDNNIGKPIPMAFGDFALRDDIGSIPTSGAEFDRYFVKGYFPAIITNQWDDADANVVATPDAVALESLSTKRVYYHGDDAYSPCEDGNVTVTTATPEITFEGTVWRAYFTLQEWNTYSALWADYEDSIDNDFDTYQTYTVDGGTHEMTTGYRIGTTPKLGEASKVSLMLTASNYGGTAPGGGSPALTYPFQITAGSDYELTWTTINQTVDITAEFSTANKDEWDFRKHFLIEIDDTSNQNDDQTVRFLNVGIEVEFAPSQSFIKEWTSSRFVNRYDGWQVVRHEIITRGVIETPEVSEYIYYSGKGREYGAWVDADSRNNGYNSGDLIENPVYMIEDILRTEVGLGSSDIDYASFDTVGNTTNGTIGNTFNQSVADIEFAFSQYRFSDAWTLCKEIGSACGCILFLSGNGTIKILSRERDEDYTSADKTIGYDELKNIKPGITSLADVRNKVSVRYNMNYALDTLTNTTAIVEDSTSQESGVNGIGGATDKVQELVIDNRFTLDSATAVGYSTALLDWLAYRKKMLSFDVLSAKHNALEIGDTIKFSDWPTTFKIYGNTITATDIYMVTKIQKYPNGCSISCQEVSEVTD